jgi:L-alanine-DL-glutamate epimerase-like enolase superfamily enzyme
MPMASSTTSSGPAERRAADARVESLQVTACTVPTDRPESDGTLEWDSTTIVVVEAAGGGECGIGYTYGHRSIADLIETKLAPLAEGGVALAPPSAWAAMQAQVRNLGHQGLASMAISAVDIALWDLRARLLGISLADSLGRFRESIEAYGSGGFTSYDEEELASQLRDWVGQGCRSVKIKVGREPERDPQRIATAREAIGEGVDLMVDANGAFGKAEAARWARRYADAGVVYLEEPVSSDDDDGLRLLRDTAPPGLQIAAGEYAWDVFELARLAPCVDVLQGDVTRCGGITGVMRADAICRAHEVSFSAHCAPQVSAHVCCAMERAVHLEHFHDHERIESLLFEGALGIEDGRLRPDPSRPGLGIELRREETRRYLTRDR